LTPSSCEIDVGLIKAKRMRDVSTVGDQGSYIGEEGAARRIARAPEHRHEFNIGLREIVVFGGRRDGIVEIPGQAIIRLYKDLIVFRIEGRDGCEAAFRGLGVLCEKGGCEKECECEYRENGMSGTHREDFTVKWILDATCQGGFAK